MTFGQIEGPLRGQVYSRYVPRAQHRRRFLAGNLTGGRIDVPNGAFDRVPAPGSPAKAEYQPGVFSPAAVVSLGSGDRFVTGTPVMCIPGAANDRPHEAAIARTVGAAAAEPSRMRPSRPQEGPGHSLGRPANSSRLMGPRLRRTRPLQPERAPPPAPWKARDPAHTAQACAGWPSSPSRLSVPWPRS